MKISRSRIYKILNTHNQSMKKPRKARKPRRRINRSRRERKRQHNLRYKTLKKGGARINLPEKTTTASELLAGYQKALAEYVDALMQDNAEVKTILSGGEGKFDDLLKDTLGKAMVEEIEKAQSADKSVLEKFLGGIVTLFARIDAGAKESFSEQLNDIVEREKLVYVVQSDLTYERSQADRQGKILIGAFGHFLSGAPHIDATLKRLGFGVGMDAYLDLEISKQEAIVDQALDEAKSKVDELRLRLDSVTDEQKAELKKILDDTVAKINMLLAMLGLFSAVGGGAISLLDYQNAKFTGFTDNPASKGAMAFSLNQKAIHSEVVNAITRRINEDISFFPGQVDALINTNIKGQTNDYQGGMVRVPKMSVYPVTSNSWKTGKPATEKGVDSAQPVVVAEANQDEDPPEVADAKAAAEERLASLEKEKGLASGVGPQSDSEWTDEPVSSPATAKKVPPPLPPKPNKKTTADPVEIEMSDLGSGKDASMSNDETGTQQTPVVSEKPVVVDDKKETPVVSEKPVVVDDKKETPVVSETPAVVDAKKEEPVVSGTPVVVDAKKEGDGAEEDSPDDNILAKCDRGLLWNEVVREKADGMVTYACPLFSGSVFNSVNYGKITKISGSDSFCGFIAVMNYLVDTVTDHEQWWQGVTGGNPEFWLNELVVDASKSRTIESGIVSFPPDLMNQFMVNVRHLSNNPSKDRYMHDSDLDALAKIVNCTFCVWEKTNSVGSGWTYVSDGTDMGIIWPPVQNPPYPCMLVHDSSDTAVAPTGHYDYVDQMNGGDKVYLTMPTEMFAAAYAKSGARRPTAAAESQRADGEARKAQASSAKSSDTEPTKTEPAKTEPAKTDMESETADGATENVPFPGSVGEVCQPLGDDEELPSGSCTGRGTFIDYFTVLGLTQPDEWSPAFKVQTKKAYTKLALKFHPDKTKGDAIKAAKFRCVSEAYAVLGNEDLYKRYVALIPLCTKKDAATTAEAQTADAPAQTTSAPAQTTNAPAQTADAPAQTTSAPAQTTSAPAQTASAPAQTTSAPQNPAPEQNKQSDTSDETATDGVSTKSTTTRLPNGDVEVNIRVQIPANAQFSINGNAGSPTETVIKGLVDNINKKKGGTRRRSQTKPKKGTRRRRS